MAVRPSIHLAAIGVWPAIEEVLKSIRILDPACGAGAFLVRMLFVLDELEDWSRQGAAEDKAARRKRIIEHNLFGADVMDWACHATQLRLALAAAGIVGLLFFVV